MRKSNSTPHSANGLTAPTAPVPARIDPKAIIAVTLGFFILLAFMTYQIAIVMVHHGVERDASRRSLEWAEFAVKQVPEIAALADGQRIEPEHWDAFRDLASFGGVFRFKIFSPDGVLRFESDDPAATGESLGKHNAIAASVVKTGEAYTTVENGRSKPNRPGLYSETYLPVYDSGRLVAIAETYMDQTSKTAAVRVEYAFVAVLMAGMILLALSIPSAGLWLMFRRLKYNNERLRLAQIRAMASDKSKSEFISTVSHELRTPLTSIKGSLEMLKSGKIIELSAPAERLVAMAAKNSNILNLLVNDLLDFERIDTGNLEVSKRPSDIVTIVKDEIETMMSYDTEQEVEYFYTGDDGPIIGNVDPDRIAQVVRNLLSNAVKFSPRNGGVFVSVRAETGAVRVVVADSGCGISPDDCARIFDKFTQVDSSDTRKHRGTGLGLAISKGIIVAHGGDIGVTSVEGVGSEFYFVVPIGIEDKRLPLQDAA